MLGMMKIAGIFDNDVLRPEFLTLHVDDFPGVILLAHQKIHVHTYMLRSLRLVINTFLPSKSISCCLFVSTTVRNRICSRIALTPFQTSKIG